MHIALRIGAEPSLRSHSVATFVPVYQDNGYELSMVTALAIHSRPARRAIRRMPYYPDPECLQLQRMQSRPSSLWFRWLAPEQRAISNHGMDETFSSMPT